MIREKLFNLLQIGRTNEAIERLLWLSKEHDKSTYNELILLSSRLNANNSMFNMNILSQNDLKLETNKIITSLLNYVDLITSADYVSNINLNDLENGINASTDDKIKILFVASNPIDTGKLELEKEYLEIRRIFNNKRNQFEVIELFNATLDEFFNTVRIEKPDVLHISAPANNDYFTFHRPDQTSRLVPYPFLASAFLLFQPHVKCVFINTWCSPIFLKKISTSLHCAIGCPSMVMDDVSIWFSSSFYTSLAQGNSYEEAFKMGIEILKQQSKDGNIPFVMFKDGMSNSSDDKTPEDFDYDEIEWLMGREPQQSEIDFPVEDSDMQ